MSGQAPVVIEPLVGFRKFLVHASSLVSPVARTRWDSAVMEAECRLPDDGFARSERHDAPHPSCSCGIYALHRRRAMMGPTRGSWAVVALWGRVEVHPVGMRGQHARVCAIAHPGGPGILATRLAECFGIDLVPLDQLDAAARDYGRPVDPWMLPGEGAPAELLRQATTGGRRPHFRFVLHQNGPRRVYPWGWWQPGRLPPVDRGFRGAVGDVFTSEDVHAVAAFAHVTPGFRAEAEAWLQDWACEDGWVLSILPATQPLRESSRPPDGKTLVCFSCRGEVHMGLAVSYAFGGRGWWHTTCPCGGRFLGARYAQERR